MRAPFHCQVLKRCEFKIHFIIAIGDDGSTLHYPVLNDYCAVAGWVSGGEREKGSGGRESGLNELESQNWKTNKNVHTRFVQIESGKSFAFKLQK